MIRSAILASLVITLISGGAALCADFTLHRDGHPRLELTGEQIEQLRADDRAVEQLRSAADAIITAGRTQTYEDYFVELPRPDFPPEHDGGWPYWTGLAGEIRSAMETTARAWVLTGNRKYIGWCRELILTVADWRQWTDPWHGSQPSLDTHHLTRGMCVALDLLWDDLPEADRATIINAIADKGAEFIYEHGNDEASYVAAPGAWPNGYAMINSTLGIAGLALLGEHERADDWLARALGKTRLFFEEEGGVDGGLVEGFDYGSAAIDNFAYFMMKADAIVGVSLFDHPYLAEAISFPAYFMTPGGGSLANFGDNGGPTGVRPTLLGLARALVKVELNPLAAWYLQRVGESAPEIAALAEQPDLPSAKHFRDIDWVAMRSGWGRSGSLLAFKSGHVAHHNHLDQNSLILAWDDEWLLNDPGYQIYDRPYPPERGMTGEMIRARHEYTFGTIGHNAILVDGEGQQQVPGRIAEFATTPAMDYAVGEASECYAGLERYLRHVMSVGGQYYTVFDELDTGGPTREVEVLLHTTPDGEFTVGGRPLPVGESRDGRECTVRRTGEAVAHFIEPQRLHFEHRQHPHCEEYGHYLSAMAPRVSEQTITWVLAAGPAGSVDVQARALDDSGRAVQVRTGDAVDTIALGGADVTEAGEMAFAGTAAMVRERGGDALRYALIDGTSLRLGETELVASNTPLSAGAVIDGRTFRATITCEEPAAVTLHCPVAPRMVRLTGIDATVDASFDETAWTLTLALPAGSFELSVRSL
ncbi:MAG: heparinase II/III family protein [Armatimonadota bacterium]